MEQYKKDKKEIINEVKMDLQKYIIENDLNTVKTYMKLFKVYNKPKGLNYSLENISEPLEDDDGPTILWEESPLQTASENSVNCMCLISLPFIISFISPCVFEVSSYLFFFIVYFLI